VPFWDLTLTVTLVCGLAVLYAFAWTALGPGWVARVSAISAMLLATLPAVMGMQFTISATIAGSAAALLALGELTSGTQRPRVRVVIASGALLLAGVLVRPMGAAAGVFTAALLLGPSLIGQIALNRVRLTQGAAMMTGAMVLVGVLAYGDSLMYRIDQSWAAYYRYNWMSAQLVEWGGELPVADTDRIRAAAGWTTNDWAMMQRWWGVDADLHGVAAVTKAYEARSARSWRDSLTRLRERFAAMSQGTLQHVSAESVIPGVAIAAVALGYASTQGWAALGLGTFLFFGLCIAIEVVFKDLPFRLLTPMQVCAATTMLVTIGARRRQPSPALAIACLGVLLTVLTYQTRDLLATAGRDHEHTAQVEREILEIQQLSPSLIVVHADAFPAEHWWRPFVQPRTALRAISLAGNNQSPALQEFLASSGRNPLFRAMCDDPSVLVISQEGRLDLVTTYFREHLDTTIQWEPAYAGSFTAWRCAR